MSWVCSCNVSSLRASYQELADALLFWEARVDLVPIQGLKVVPVDFFDTSSNKILLDLISAKYWMWFLMLFLKIKGWLFSRKFLLRVLKLWPPSWKYFSALSAFSNGRKTLVAASNNLQDLHCLSHYGGGELAGSKDLEPILFSCYFSAWCFAQSMMLFSDPSVCFLLPGGSLWK